VDSQERVAWLVAGRLVHRSELLAQGVSSRALSRAVQRGLVRRMAPTLYGPPGTPIVPEDLRSAAVRGVVCHLSAALLHGLEVVHDPDAHSVAVGRHSHRRPKPGWRWHRCDVPERDAVERGDVRVTSVLRTLVDLLRDLPASQSVPVVDSALRQRRARFSEVSEAVAALPPCRGRARALASLGLVDGRSGSVLESMTRVLLVVAGLAPEAAQLRIEDEGRLVARVDFAWPSARLVLEADGFAFHSSRRDFCSDRRRRNRLVLLGWTVLHVTWEDVVADPDAVVQMVAAALDRAGQAAASSRSL
jgi:hypothetical protein